MPIPTTNNQLSRGSVNRGAYSRARLADLRVQIVVAFIEDNYQRKLTLSDMADAVSLSVWRLAHVFKTQVGISPEHYLATIRLARAKYYLESSFHTVKEVAALVGARDLRHFTKSFKAAYGLTPGEYRNLHLQRNLSAHCVTSVARSTAQ